MTFTSEQGVSALNTIVNWARMVAEHPIHNIDASLTEYVGFE